MLGQHYQFDWWPGDFEGAVMTAQERELCLKIRAQQVLGKGMFLNDVEFKAWAAKEYNISESRMTQLMKESI